MIGTAVARRSNASIVARARRQHRTVKPPTNDTANRPTNARIEIGQRDMHTMIEMLVCGEFENGHMLLHDVPVLCVVARV